MAVGHGLRLAPPGKAQDGNHPTRAMHSGYGGAYPEFMGWRGLDGRHDADGSLPSWRGRVQAPPDGPAATRR